MNMDKVARGLSPSSLTLFQSCQRKYFYKKIAELPIDLDASEDTESFQVGKAFHKCLEDTKHDLDGYTVEQCREVAKLFDLSDDYHLPLIMAMLKKYKSMHLRAGLKAIACEVVIDTPTFYGITDVILEDEKGWWIGDMKTAASFYANIIPGMPRHQQLNLYAFHSNVIADKLGIDPKGYRGCRYRLTTKSKLTRKPGENLKPYIDRLAVALKSFDFIIPKSFMNPSLAAKIHVEAKKFIDKNSKESKYTCNFNSCMQWNRPCAYFSRCHGRNFTEMSDLEAVTSS
jgi:hypothetical protein